jgi:hypothetical protein
MMMMTKQRRYVCISLALLALVFTLGGCTQQAVTVDDQPVNDATLRRVAQAVAAADKSTAAAVHFLIAGYRSGVIQRSVLMQYSTDIGPKVQATLDAARDMVVTIARTPEVVSGERVNQVLSELTKAVQIAVTFAAQHGYKESQL